MIPAQDLALSGALEVAVHNPAPKHQVSAVVHVAIANPTPILQYFVPLEIHAGHHGTPLGLRGENFRPNSAVRWNGEERPADFTSEQSLSIVLTAADLQAGSRAQVSVHNPGPGGGDASLEFLIFNDPSYIDELAPAHVTMGSGDIILNVRGEAFVDGAVVRWDGRPKPTTFLGPDHLQAHITADELAAAKAVAVTVLNRDPVPAMSNAVTFQIHPSGRFVVDLHLHDLVADPARARLYASVRSSDPRYAGEIVALDPTTGTVVDRVAPGGAAGVLAIADDGSKLYAGLRDQGSIARIDLASFTVDLKFPIHADSGLAWLADDIDVMPGTPGTVAVAHRDPAWSPRQRGVAVYDNGVVRPIVTPRYTGGNRVQFASPNVLFGHEGETSSFRLFRIDVTADGATTRDYVRDAVQFFENDLRYGEGYLFFSSGEVFDAQQLWPAATLPAFGVHVPEPGGGSVHYVTGTTLHSFSTRTWVRVASTELPGVPRAIRSLVRWGTDGFAYVSDWHAVIFRHTLAAP